MSCVVVFASAGVSIGKLAAAITGETWYKRLIFTVWHINAQDHGSSQVEVEPGKKYITLE